MNRLICFAKSADKKWHDAIVILWLIANSVECWFIFDEFEIKTTSAGVLQKYASQSKIWWKSYFPYKHVYVTYVKRSLAVSFFFLSIILLVVFLFFSVRVSCYADLLWIAFHSCTNNVLYRHCFRRNARNIVKRNLIQLGYIHIYAHLHWIFTWYFVHIYRIGISSQFHQILHLLQRITNSSLFFPFLTGFTVTKTTLKCSHLESNSVNNNNSH